MTYIGRSCVDWDGFPVLLLDVLNSVIWTIYECVLHMLFHINVKASATISARISFVLC